MKTHALGQIESLVLAKAGTRYGMPAFAGMSR
jgi:hypothetical protein